MTYNPYLYLPRFAGLNLLRDEDRDTHLYAIRDALVYTGAYTASFWLVNGKPRSREEDIALTMDSVQPYVELMPFPAALAQELIERGFDWLLQFDLAADTDKQNMEQS